MYQEIIDPFEHGWLDDDAGSVEFENWLDGRMREQEEDEAAALHAYECKVYNERDRRYV